MLRLVSAILLLLSVEIFSSPLDSEIAINTESDSPLECPCERCEDNLARVEQNYDRLQSQTMCLLKVIDYDQQRCSAETKLRTELSRPLDQVKEQMKKWTDAFLAR